MRQMTHFPKLSGALKARAEAFFGEDLSGVVLRAGGLPSRLGAAAVTFGDTIHLAPWLGWLPPRALEEIIAHELAHVVQQRDGRVAPRRRVAGVDVNDDESLEAEAEALGRRFASRRGGPSRSGRARARAGPPVAQCAVSVGGVAIPQAGALSERARLVLRLIDGGVEWLSWAASDGTVRYDFNDEKQLVAAVQSGLHASPLTLLPAVGLLVSPVKLMSLPPGDLKILLTAESGDTATMVEHQIAKVLSDAGLVSQSQLAGVAGALGDMGIAAAPVVQTMGLDAHLAFYELMDRSRSSVSLQPELQKEASAFGLQQARTPFELVDYYKAYLITAAKADLLAGSSDLRASAAQSAVQALLPSLFGALDGLQVSGTPRPEEVGQLVRSSLSVGKQIGFARLSLGVQQIIESTDFVTRPRDTAKAAMQSYLTAAQALLTGSDPDSMTLGQDGATCVYSIEEEGAEVCLELSPAGILTLRSFRPQTPPAQGGEAATDGAGAPPAGEEAAD